MSIDRLTRVNELLRREIGQALYHVLKDFEVDISAVTITRVRISGNLRTARVGVSIRDHQGERQKMLGRLKRHRSQIQQIIHKNVVLKYTPRLLFELDESVEKGDHVLDILRDMEAQTPSGAEDDGDHEEMPGEDHGEDPS